MTERLIKLAFDYIRKQNRESALKKGEAIASLLRAFKYRKNVVFKNLDISFPDKENEWKEKIYFKTISNIGRNLVEFPRIPDYYKTGKIKELVEIKEGRDLLESFKRKGAILTTAHIGNWEIAGSALVSYGYPITALAYRQKNQRVNSFIENVRKSSGLSIIYHDQSLKSFLKALNKGDFIAFLVDQNALRHRGIFVDFFNLPASTVTFPAKLAVKYKKPVLFSLCVFNEKNKRYEIYIREVTKGKEKSIEEVTYLYTKKVEEAVKIYPEQYLWTHKRWKTRPEGEEEFY